MNKREYSIKFISDELVKWQIKIENLNSLNLYDANLFSEDSICNILNAIFDYTLKNTNSQKNYPAIDLADEQNKISVQVTSTKSKSKVQSTLDVFFENNLDEKFDELFILILGKKQKRYTALKVKQGFLFDVERHIIDFKDILKFISFLPTDKIERILKIFEQEHLPTKQYPVNSNSSRIKQNLSLKKKLKRDLLRKLENKYWTQASFEPWIRFKYKNVTIRSVDDKSWPVVDEAEEGRISSWFKSEFWDFYENGLELISLGGSAIFDKEGNWDVLNWRGDEREKNPNYSVKNFQFFLRIPFEYIVDYDMDPDPYYGSPTIYVEYRKNGTPYEDVIYGTAGRYLNDNYSESRPTYYFDNNDRRTLK